MNRCFKTLILLLLISFLLVSCNEVSYRPGEIVRAMLPSHMGSESGSIYTTNSSVGSPDHLSIELLTELFGDGFDFSEVSGAVYLSGSVSLFELAFFDCPTPDIAEAVGGICAIRFAEASKTAKKLGLDIVGSTVKIYGNCVFAAMCEGSEDAVARGLEKIKD